MLKKQDAKTELITLDTRFTIHTITSGFTDYQLSILSQF